jgi:hypothetical protein
MVIYFSGRSRWFVVAIPTISSRWFVVVAIRTESGDGLRGRGGSIIDLSMTGQDAILPAN